MNIARTSEDQDILTERANRFADALVAGQRARREDRAGDYAKAADSLVRFFDDYRHAAAPARRAYPHGADEINPSYRTTYRVADGYGTCGPYYVR